MTGQRGMVLDGAESHAETTNPVPSGFPPITADSVSTDTTAGYRGMLHPTAGMLYSGSPDTEIWSMDLIKELDTAWTDFENEDMRVGDVLPRIQSKITHWGEYVYLVRSMRVYGQQVPVRVFKSLGPATLDGIFFHWPARIRDGINRIAIADLLGWDSMLVTTGIMEKSMWQQWDESDEGRRFHDLKASRMGFRK